VLRKSEKGILLVKVLFVCTGNTCRSPMAEYCCRALSGGRNVSAQSAGLSAAEGTCASAHAKAVCAEQGMDLEPFRSRRLTGEMLREADVIFGMTQAHVQAIVLAALDCAGKVRLLGNGVPDPYGGDLPCYRKAFAAIQSGVEDFLKSIPTF